MGAGSTVASRGRPLGRGPKVRAAVLAATLAELSDVGYAALTVEGRDPKKVCEGLKARGVLAQPAGPDRIRLVTHFDVGDEDVEAALAAFGPVLAAS